MRFDPRPLRRVRREREISAAAVGAVIGRDHNQVSRYERGLQFPKADIVALWLAYLDVDPSDVFVADTR